MYKSDDYIGEKLTLYGPQAVDLVFSDKIKGWNDNIRSMIVSDVASSQFQVYWEQVIVYSGVVKQSIEIGIDNTKSFTDESTFGLAFSASTT